MSFVEEIRKCEKCIYLHPEYSDRLNTRNKPYVFYEVEKKWKPRQVRVLFVAESPPRNGKEHYFYNMQVEGALRKEILNYLEIGTLENFKNQGCFLVDTIKCRLDKTRKKNVPSKVIRVCSEHFLKKEIETLKPEILFVLGNTAKKGLQLFSEFKRLRNYKVSENCSLELNLSGQRIILCVFPSGQTRRYEDRIKKAFERLRLDLLQPF